MDVACWFTSARRCAGTVIYALRTCVRVGVVLDCVFLCLLLCALPLGVSRHRCKAAYLLLLFCVCMCAPPLLSLPSMSLSLSLSTYKTVACFSCSPVSYIWYGFPSLPLPHVWHALLCTVDPHLFLFVCLFVCHRRRLVSACDFCGPLRLSL